MKLWIEEPKRIPVWITLGRTVLIPKTQDLTLAKDYRPITCLNTSYKIFTATLAKYVKNHVVENEIWDENQMGTCENVLGTVDQLIIDNAIMGEVKDYHRNLAVAYYDYQKAYDMVHHDWMLRVYDWMGIPEKICKVIKKLMNGWKTRLEVKTNKEVLLSRWINIKKGFLQEDTYSPIGFCLTEIPVMMMLQETDGYKMGLPGDRQLKRTHSLFIDDLKTYQENHVKLELANNILVQASLDTGAMYGVKKCAKIIFERGKMVKGNGLQIMGERIEALNPENNEIYKFLGCEQAAGSDMTRILVRVESEMRKRMIAITEMSLYDKNMIKAINCRVIPVAGYVMNVCRFTNKQLDELDKMIKSILKERKMHGRQCSNERLYLKRDAGGRGLKSLKDVYAETKVRVACYMANSKNKWIHEAWKREINKEGLSIKKEAECEMAQIDIKLELLEDEVRLEDERLEGDFQELWKVLKKEIKKKRKKKRLDSYKEKKMQSQTYMKLDIESHKWLTSNIDPKKVAAIVAMQEQMVETKAWKVHRGIGGNNDRCRLCKEYQENVMHLLSGCKVLAGTEYLRRHNNALMILCVEWGKLNGLLPPKTSWYKEKWEKGKIFENENQKMCWDFEYNLRKTTTARRPDVTIEDKNSKKILLIDMACPNENNIAEKRREKLTKYQQLAFEIRERRPGFEVTIVPIVIGCLGGGMKAVISQVKRLDFGEHKTNEICREMLKTVLFESESIIRKIISGLIQEN